MKIIETGCWEVTNSTTKTINLNRNKAGDTVASELYLNPLTNCTIVVRGFVSDEDNTGIILNCVDIGNLEKVNEVTKAGNYCYIVGSYYKVNINITGTSKVIYKYLY